MKTKGWNLGLYTLVVVLLLFVFGCASSGYNTQKGAALGAGAGALAGQAIGRDTEGTLIGAGAGALLGSILGNAADQSYYQQRQRQARPSYEGRVPSRSNNPAAASRYGYAEGERAGRRKATERNYQWGRRKGYSESYDHYTSPRYRERALD